MSYLSERICKTNQPEQRPEYWRQAVEVINQKPLVGTGLGTFSAVSLQHRKAPGSYAAHAHNDYLEWIAEAGWWGVFVTVCLWGIWWKFRPRTADWFVRAVWLSIGSVLTLGLFDFDLQFVVFLFAVLVGLGWLIGFQQRTSQKTTESVWLKILVSFITIVIVGWAALFLALNLDWQQGNKQLLAKYGHYYPAHSFLLVKLWPELHEAKRSELLQLWQRDYRVLDFLLDEQGKSFDSVTTSQMLQHFYAINPWSRLKYDLVALQLQHNELESARQTLQGTDAFADTQQARFDVTFKSEGDQLRWRQAQQYLALAEKELERDNGLQVVADVSHAAQFEPWILDDPNTKYCSGLKNWVRQKHNNDPVWLAAWSEQLKLFDSINPWLFGSCKTDLSQMALEQLKVQLQHNRCSGEICKIWSYRALRWSENELWVQSFLTRLRVEFPTQEF